MLATILSFIEGIDKRILMGVVAGLGLWFVGYLGGKQPSADKEAKLDRTDTKAQVRKDREDGRKNDEEVVDDFAGKFSGR